MPASPRTARVINDRLALDHLLREGPLTAARLKELTGLSRPTVADLVDRLTGAGLIRIVGESGADRRGPNARLYGLVAERAHLAALDVRTSGSPRLAESRGPVAHRVLQEALTNAMRHAPGARVQITFADGPEGLLLRVENDAGNAGGGFPSAGAGLEGMRDRVEGLAGTLVWRHTPEGGFSVEARLPREPEPAR